MNIQTISEAFLIAFFLVGWSVVGGRLTNGVSLATGVTITSAVTVAALSVVGGRLPVFFLNATFFVLALIAIALSRPVSDPQVGAMTGSCLYSVIAMLGIVNGFGVFRYADRLSRIAQSGASVGQFIVTVSVAAVVVAPLLEMALRGKPISAWHLSGYACAGLAIFLLSR